jgi:hypothetical protein
MNRSSAILLWMFLAGTMAVVTGSLIAPVFQMPVYFLNKSFGFSIDDAPGLFITTATAGAFLAFIHLTLLAMLAFLPVRYFWKRPVSLGKVLAFTALVGGLLNLITWNVGPLEDLYLNSLQQMNWITIGIHFATGFLYGGLFGCFYFILERRGGGLPSRRNGMSSGNAIEQSGTSQNAGPWIVGCLLLLLALGVVWMFTKPFRMITTARISAVRHQDALMQEARKMLEEAALAKDEQVTYGRISERPLPEAFAKLGDVLASTTNRVPGAIKVQVTGGFSHYGLYIIPDRTSETRAALIREGKTFRVVNDHIIQVDEEAH